MGELGSVGHEVKNKKKEGKKGVGNEMLGVEKSKYGGKFRVF